MPDKYEIAFFADAVVTPAVSPEPADNKEED